MAYFLDLFTPLTWEAFQKHGASVSGFRIRQLATAERIEIGDIFVCYLVRLSRWCGILEVTSTAYQDSTPIFGDPDPFSVRFRVAPRVILSPEFSIPIYEDKIWRGLSITRTLPVRTVGWAQHANLRSSLRELSDEDGRFLETALTQQEREKRSYLLTTEDKRRISAMRSIQTIDRDVVVEVPDDEERDSVSEETTTQPDSRESIRYQATVAQLGAEMGFRIWVPRSDRQRVIQLVPTKWHMSFIDALPLNYDDTTLRTISQIDVIWLKNRSMARAFEVEHTTAVYSGLLRMADLLALQPNMDIRLHIVAPDEKREKVLRELRRPVFSLLERGPLYESCSYLSYESLAQIAQLPHLSHTNDSILDEYAEVAGE